MDNIQFNKKLKEDLISAMKSKDQLRLLTLRSISTAITNIEKSNKQYNYIDVLSTLAKQRQQSIDQYKQANNNDAANIELVELEIIQQYLPIQLDEDSLSEIINEFIDTLENVTIKDMGKIMSYIKETYPGQDMKLISNIIKNKINV